MTFRPRTVLLASLLTCAAVAFVRGQTLHERIDACIRKQSGGPVAAAADDAEFLRRVSLDLTGVIPTADETRQFLADADPAKRQKLIDRLLDSPTYARRMREALTVILLERREGAAVPQAAWDHYLEASFAANKPWNQLAGEILSGDGRDAASQAAVKFFVDGGRAEVHQMTRDVGRLFLGMDMQCAQCHNHPTIDDYRQSDYYGLLAFLTASKVHKNSQDQKTYFVEQPLPEPLEFESVFIPGVKDTTGPRLPGGRELEVPQFEKGQEVAEPAKDGFPPVPKFRPRAALAQLLAAADNARFVQNSVNRFWNLMMGRGLVHPLDQIHPDNPPSHPELMQVLSDEFVAHQFDVKWLLREIARSDAYQRSSRLPAGVASAGPPPESYRAAIPKPLSPEQTAWSLLQATGNLQRLAQAPAPNPSKFTVKDYINGRIDPPANLSDVMTLFVGVFGNPPGEAETEFNPAMGHALFLMNERLLLDWLKPQPGNLVERLANVSSAEAVAEELYLSVLTRLPTDEERAEVAAYLAASEDRRPAAVGELAWALLASAEFRLNH